MSCVEVSFLTKDKREFRKRIAAFFSVFLCLLLVGCQTSVAGQKEQITTENGEEEEELSEETAKTQTKSLVLGIDRPTVSSNIAIDLQGYAPADLKYAHFTGADLQDIFYVYRQKDKQVVYQGSIQQTGEAGKAWGDFSEVTEPGSYYIQTAVIGRSYTFQIYEDRYQSQFETDRESWQSAAPEDYYTAEEETDYQALMILAMLQEFYAEPEAGADSKLQEDADYLIQYHTEQAKSSVSGSDADMADVRAEYCYAAAMAQCYHVLKNEAGAAAYLKQAQTAYQTAARSRSRTDMAVSPEQYMAAAALFKVTGSYSYHQVIKQYEAAEDITKDTAGFWGDLFYLTSLQRVDTKLCEQQMNRLLKECGELCDSVLSQHAMENRADSLTAMLKLAVADDTLVSLEYRNACKTLLHAFCGDMEDMDCGQRSALLFIEGELAESEVKK